MTTDAGPVPDPTRSSWWRRVKLWQVVVAPASVAVVMALVTPAIADLVTPGPAPAVALAAPLVVRNPLPAGEDVGDGERQTDASKPALDVTVRNSGDEGTVLHRARFTVRGFGVLGYCGDGAGAALQVSAEYDVEVPLDPRVGDWIDAPIRHTLGSDEADRFAFRFGNPELGPTDIIGFVYLLDVELVHGLDERSLDVGSVLISVPGIPSLEAVGPGEYADPGCVAENRALLDQLLAGEPARSPELDELAAGLAA
jgi:hypothetical protein